MSDYEQQERIWRAWCASFFQEEVVARTPLRIEYEVRREGETALLDTFPSRPTIVELYSRFGAGRFVLQPRFTGSGHLAGDDFLEALQAEVVGVSGAPSTLGGEPARPAPPPALRDSSVEQLREAGVFEIWQFLWIRAETVVAYEEDGEQLSFLEFREELADETHLPAEALDELMAVLEQRLDIGLSYANLLEAVRALFATEDAEDEASTAVAEVESPIVTLVRGRQVGVSTVQGAVHLFGNASIDTHRTSLLRANGEFRQEAVLREGAAAATQTFSAFPVAAYCSTCAFPLRAEERVCPRCRAAQAGFAQNPFARRFR